MGWNRSTGCECPRLRSGARRRRWGTVRGIWREGENAPHPAHPLAESHAHRGPGGKGFCWESGPAGGVRACAGCSAARRGGGARCAEKRGGVVGAAVLAAVGEGAAAGFLVLRTDAIGAPGKVRIQPQTGPGESEWNEGTLCPPHPQFPAPGSEQSPSTQNLNPLRPAV